MSKITNNSTQNLLKALNVHGTHHTTTHTKLDTIALNTANIKLSTDSVNLNVDTLEALQQTTINHLDGVIGHINNTNAIGSGQNALKSMSLGYDRTNDKGVAILVDSAGHVQTDIVSSVLPTGGSTSALQGDIESSLNSLISANHTDLEHVSSDLDTANGHLNTIAGDTTSLDGKVTACNTGAVVISSSALPSNASIASHQTTNHDKLDHLSTDLDTANGHLNTIDGKITACNTGAVVVSSSGLPSGAATSALQGDIESSLNTLIGANHTDLEHVSSDLDTANGHLNTIDGKITACNTGAVVVSSSGLPSGAATSALQGDIESSLNTLIGANHTDLEHVSSDLDTANGHLNTIKGDTTSIDGKITACNTGAVVISSGAVTATLSATDNAVLDVIAGDTTSLDGKVTACNTGAVVISSGAVTATLSATDNAVLDAIESSLNSLITANHSDFGTLDTTCDGVGVACESIDSKITACNTGAVVISSGAVTATLSATDNAVLDTIDSVLDTIKVDTEAIETAVLKLSGVSEAVWLNNATINAQALGASLDTTGYTKVRLYGVVDQSFFSGVSELLVMGSLTDGGVYFNLGANVSNEVGASNGASVQTFNCLLESPPKFIKIKNDSGSDNYAMTINAKMTHT